MAGEPATNRGRQSRDRVIAAADRIAAERGVHGASLAAILRAAAVSKSQLYHYFSDKDELVHAVVAHRRATFLGHLRPFLIDLDSWNRIEQWFRTVIEMQEQQGFPGCPIGTLASELADRDEIARGQLADSFHEWQGYLAEGLARMRTRGELTQDADPATLATAILAVMQGGLVLAKTSKDAAPLRIALDAALAHLRTFASSPPARRR